MDATNETEGKKLKLTVFLIKDGIDTYDTFLSISGYEILEIKEDTNILGTLIYKGGFKSEPSWADLFKDVEGFKSEIIFNLSSKAVYVTKYEGRWFCFTFGHSRHLIDDLSYERNFGLIVTLNLGNPSAIKSIDKISISHISLQSREQATKEIELMNFEFDDDVDLLKSATAVVEGKEGEEKEIVSGRDSVTIYTRVEIKDFTDIVKKLYAAYTSDLYKTRYPWIDKIKEERDKSISDALDLELVNRIKSNNLDNIWLAVPEVLDWESVSGFSYRYKKKVPSKSGHVVYPDLNLHQWYSQARINSDLTIKKLIDRKVYINWRDDSPPDTWSIYRCLNAEVDLNNEKYVLNDGMWYNIESNFVSDVTAYFQSIPSSSLQLPRFETRNEPEYLSWVCQSNNTIALMDRKEVMIGGGRSRVEFCDLYTNNKKIIHVKRYGGSSLLSHLFQQALVSGECFLHELEFREKLNELLPNGFKLTTTVDSPKPSEYEICIAIMSEVPGALELPFFSKVSFKYSVKHLKNLGYNVTKLKIER